MSIRTMILEDLNSQRSQFAEAVAAKKPKIPEPPPNAWPYENKSCILLPYEAWPNRDGLLGLFYMRCKLDGILPVVFDSGLDFDKFVTYFSRKNVAMQVWGLKTPTTVEPAGFGWVEEVTGTDEARRAMFGFLVFKEYRRRLEVADLGLLSLAYWFYELKITHLFGATDEANRPARNFARRYQFTEVACLPDFLYRNGSLCNATVVMLERTVFEPQWHEWFEKRAVIQ